jgi:spore maturation protein CgeB
MQLESLKYRKFVNEPLRCLIFRANYHMLFESSRALKKMGHLVRMIPTIPLESSDEQIVVKTDERQMQEHINRMLKSIYEFRPDFILSVNHIGFDEGGLMTEILTRIEMPHAVWYVDSPTFILKGESKTNSPFCTIFTWERRYIGEMRKIGFGNVHHLMLATDPDIFNSGSGVIRRSDKTMQVSFVGNSMVEPTSKWQRLLYRCDRLSEFVRHASVYKLKDRSIDMDGMIRRYREEREKKVHFPSKEMRWVTESAIVWNATMRYRAEFINRLARVGVDVYGDDGWHIIAGKGVRIHRRVHYYRELPSIYCQSKINMNTTSFQMATAVNQRVFDVPACGGFLITDAQDDLFDILKEGEDCAIYRHVSELPEVVSWYLKNESVRERMAISANRKIVSRHTYINRMAGMIEILKKNYAH